MHNVNGRKKKRVEEEEKNSAVSADKASLVHFVIFPPPFPPLKIWRFVVVAFLFFWMDGWIVILSVYSGVIHDGDEYRVWIKYHTAVWIDT